MNKRKAIAAANAALPQEVQIRYASEWQEWQVTYPLIYRLVHSSCPASDFADAVGTAHSIAVQMGLDLREPLNIESWCAL